MPHLRIRGVSEEVVQKLSGGLNSELARLVQISPDNFTLESISTRFFNNGPTDEGYPIVEVHWFERTQEIKTLLARYLTDRMRKLVEEKDVAIVFRPIAKTDYFENGAHF